MRRRWWIVGLTMCVIVLAAGAATAALALTHSGPFDSSLPFDRAVWQDRHQKAGVRLRMAEHLTWRHTLDGKSRAEVASLLGSPNANYDWPGWDLAYRVGPVGLGLDEGAFVVRFGPDGRVSEVRIVQRPVSPESD